MKRYALAAALVVMASTAPAVAQPTPNPAAPAHTGTGCANVISRNPNTGPNGHISDQGLTRITAVGAALCGL